jgi:dUTP pyrophosphatase
MAVEVKFAKVHPGAVIPSKREEDMGFDIYACFDEDYIEIPPHETKLIPTGIASSCDKEYGFILRERGSTGSKGIALRCGVIDSGFRGQWFVGWTNTTDEKLFISKVSAAEIYKQELKIWNPEGYESMNGFVQELIDKATIYPYEKAIAQALVMPVPKVKIQEILYDDLKNIESERGAGALGSSNK